MGHFHSKLLNHQRVHFIRISGAIALLDGLIQMAGAGFQITLLIVFLNGKRWTYPDTNVPISDIHNGLWYFTMDMNYGIYIIYNMDIIYYDISFPFGIHSITMYHHDSSY